MPLKNPDPFASRADQLDAAVNPYVGTLRTAARDGSLPVAFGEQLAGLAGRWRAQLAAAHGRATPPERLVLEIGCHKGQTLLAMAADAPDVGFIGLDITFKRVVTTAERAHARGLTNVFCAMANARAIDHLFAPGELDGVVIFFPDPWVKKPRQAKHRLIDQAFTTRLVTVLAPGGYLWLKTDQASYFATAAAVIGGAAFAPDAGAAPAADYTSAFQARYRAQNLPTYEGKWRRNASRQAGMPA